MSQMAMNNMQQMNNMGMNVGAGGAGGGGIPGGQPNGPGNPQMGPNPASMNMPRGMEKTLLNTYIYEYFLKNEMFDCAKSLLNEADVHTIPNSSSRRQSPSRRQKHDADGNMINGIDESMDADTKDGVEGGDRRGDDLPLPKVPAECPQGSFLYDWWTLFWDIFGARTTKQGSVAAMTYLNSTQNAQRMRQEQQQRLMQMGQLNPQQQALLAANGQIPGQLSQANIVRQAMVNNANRKQFPGNQQSTPQQINQLKAQQLMQQQMQRGQSGDGEMNGPQRPQSPATGQTAPSPSKRMRVEGEFQPGNGRGQPQHMTSQQVQASQMLLSAGINPNQLTQQQFLQFQGSNPEVQQKSIQAYAQNLANHQRSQLPKAGMPNAQVGVTAAHGAPMMPQTSADGGPGGNMNDFYAGGAQPLGRGLSGAGGNHALQDYQMQLMLLEQQNKKRLMMARAEQDQIQLRGNEARPDGSVGFQGMSPNAGRAAPSPQPSQDMKRGTPKMAAQQGPGSPLPGGQMPENRGSPAASIAAFNGQVFPEHQSFNNPMSDITDMNGQPNMPNGNMMRPPSSHPGFNGQMGPQMGDMNPALRQQQQQQAGRGQPGAPGMWQQHPIQSAQAQAAQQHMAQQMAQQQQQQQQQGQGQQGPQQGQQQPGQQAGAQQGNQPQPQNAGTPGQGRGNVPHQSMPPPSAPTGPNNGRPNSPQSNQQQPPTPTQSNKPTPRNKKEKEANRKRPNKKAAANATSAAATNAATPSEPPTPTTPITPHPVNSFNAPNQQNKNQAGGFQNNPPANVNAPPQQQPTPQPAPAPAPAPPAMEEPAFSSINEENSTGLFDDFDTTNTILDNFDFDSFLNTDDPSGVPFDASMFNLGGDDGGVETAAGES